MSGLYVFSCYCKSKSLCLLKTPEVEQSLLEKLIRDWAQTVRFAFQHVSTRRALRLRPSPAACPPAHVHACSEASLEQPLDCLYVQNRGIIS